MSVSMRGLIATLAMVVTVPSASSRIGTGLFCGCGDRDRHDPLSARALARRRAADDSPFQRNTAPPARASAAATPTSQIRFFIARFGPAYEARSRTP